MIYFFKTSPKKNNTNINIFWNVICISKNTFFFRITKTFCFSFYQDTIFPEEFFRKILATNPLPEDGTKKLNISL